MGIEENPDFSYFIAHFDTMLGCPQCEAKERRKHIDDYSRGARIAIRSVLLSPHECDGSWDRKTWYDEEENKGG